MRQLELEQAHQKTLEINRELSQKTTQLNKSHDELLKALEELRQVAARNQVILAERKQAEELLRSVLNTVGEGIITIDPSSTIVMVNQEVQNIFGYQQEELIGQKLPILMPEKYRQAHGNRMKRYLQTGVAQHIGRRMELEGVRKNGSYFP